MAERTAVDIATLAGETKLTGFSRDSIAEERYGTTETCERLRIVLGGVGYEFLEDPSDGYRSSGEGPFVIERSVVPKLPRAVRVLALHRTEGRHYGKDDVLELVHLPSGKTILEVGTDNIDDYYPSWVCNWMPEAAGLTVS